MIAPSDVAQLVSYLAAAYPRWEPKPETVLVWEHALSAVTAAQAFEAAQIHVRTSKWPPAPAEILELVKRSAPPDERAPTPDDAWIEVRRMREDRSYTEDPPEPEDWSHPAIAVAVRSLGSWRRFYDISQDEAPHVERNFKQSYTRALERRDLDETVRSVRELPMPHNLTALSAGIGD